MVNPFDAFWSLAPNFPWNFLNFSRIFFVVVLPYFLLQYFTVHFTIIWFGFLILFK